MKRSHESFRPRCPTCHKPWIHMEIEGAITVGYTIPSCTCPNPLYRTGRSPNE